MAFDHNNHHPEHFASHDHDRDETEHAGDAHSDSSEVNKLWIVLILVGLYCVAEVIGGMWTGSLALLADAGHMASDLAALAASLTAAWLMKRPPNDKRTFGYHRAEAIAAIFNGLLLFVVAGGVLIEAVHRFFTPPEILGLPMLVIAIGGLLVNLLSLNILHQHKDENLNLRGAWLHVLGDTLGSVAVIIAAICIWLLNWQWVDPIVSLLACLLILYSAWHLLIDALHIVMENTPKRIQLEEVRSKILQEPGVISMHCLHVWHISSQAVSMTAHLVIQENASPFEVLKSLQAKILKEFGIEHVTLQLEQQGQCDIDSRTDSCLPASSNHQHSHGCSHS